MKIGIEGDNWTAEYYEATVVSVVDYYPFGSAMAGRKYNQGSYRYGFNGKEEDKEWGSQMIQDYGFRIYNPTIGKFLSVDPLAQSYPWFTPYQFASNIPIAAYDLDGLEAASGVCAVQNAEAIDGVRLSINYDFGLHDRNAAQNADHHKLVSKNLDFTKSGNDDIALMVGETVLGTLLPPAGWALDAKDFYVAFSEGDGWGMFFAGVGFLPFGDLAKNGYKATKIGTKISIEATGKNAKSLGEMTLKEGKDIRSGKKIKICQGCFTGEVKVKTEFGYKPIKDIKVGDKVWAYNDTTKTLELKSVVRTIKLDFSQLYKISFGNDYVNATYEHPFYTSKGWKDAEDLRLGDSLFVYGDKWLVISNITYFEKTEVVYNFIVEDFHTYFVSEGDILVHNGDPCDFNNFKLDGSFRKRHIASAVREGSSAAATRNTVAIREVNYNQDLADINAGLAKKITNEQYDVIYELENGNRYFSKAGSLKPLEGGAYIELSRGEFKVLGMLNKGTLNTKRFENEIGKTFTKEEYDRAKKIYDSLQE